MLVVNGKEIPVYKLDTEKTIILRIAKELNTLTKYLYGLPSNILEHKKIKVLDLLSLIKNQESTDIKDFIEENKDKLRQYVESYRTTNADKIKEYRDTNKEKFRELKNEKFTCCCGGKYTKSNTQSHLNTEKHEKYILSIYCI